MRLLYGQEIGEFSEGSQLTLPDLNDTGKYYVTKVLSTLYVGAYDTDAYPSGIYAASIKANGITAYLATATGAFDTMTVFEVTDANGRLHRLKKHSLQGCN